MDIYLYGCGSHGKVIMDILYKQGRGVKAFVDDNPPADKDFIHRVPVYKTREMLDSINPETSQWIVCIGNNSLRQSIASKLEMQGYSFTTAIHPSSQIALGVDIAPGTVLMANTVINIDTKIGSHVIINTGSTIDHDCTIGDYCHIAPGSSLSGGVNLGTGVFLGVGTCVSPSTDIGAHATCGAGSVVVNSLPSRCLAYGCPAKVVQTVYSN